MRSAAGPDLGKINRGNLKRVTGAGEQPRAHHDAGADGVLLGAHNLTVLHHRRFGRRATHVKGDDLVEVHRTREGLRANDAARGP